MTFGQREIGSSFCGAAGRSERSCRAIVTPCPPAPSTLSFILLPAEGTRVGIRLALQGPAHTGSTKWTSDDWKEPGREVWCHQSQPLAACACEQGKGDPLRCVSRPLISPRRSAGQPWVTQSCRGSLGLPSPISLASPPRTLRHVPGPRRSEASPSLEKVWMHGWETLITTTPPTKKPQ